MATVAEAVSTPTSETNGDETLYEIIDGQRVELPPMSMYSIIIATRLIVALGVHTQRENLGEVLGEGLFHLPYPGNKDRRPDISFVSYQRRPKNQTRQAADDRAWNVVPELVVEVVSPTDTADDLMEKVEEYFRSGVNIVWVIYPLRELVYVYESLTQVRGLTREEALDGGAVLPGFRLPVAELFPASNS